MAQTDLKQGRYVFSCRTNKTYPGRWAISRIGHDYKLKQSLICSRVERQASSRSDAKTTKPNDAIRQLPQNGNSREGSNCALMIQRTSVNRFTNVYRSEEPPYKKSSRLRAISSYLVDFCGDRKDKTARPTRGCGSAQTERLCSYCVLDVPDSVPCGMLSSRVLPSMNGLDRDSFLTHRCHTEGVQTSPPPGRSRRLT